jgi:hypothetical protein
MVTTARVPTTYRQAKDFLTSILWIRFNGWRAGVEPVTASKSKATQDTVVDKACN